MATSTIKDYKDFLAKVSESSGLDFTPDESGLVTMRVDDSYTINLQHIPEKSKILCFVDIATLPKTCGKEVYRQLLAGTLFGRDTAGGYFALEDESETVVYNYMIDFDPTTIDVDDTVHLLEKLLSLVDLWVGRIAGLVENGGDAPDDSEQPAGSGDGLFIKV